MQDEGATLESLGEALGISKERVRQIESRALEKLRVALGQRQLGLPRLTANTRWLPGNDQCGGASLEARPAGYVMNSTCCGARTSG